MSYSASNASTLSALAEPNRLHIVELLREGPRPVNYLVKRLKMRQPQVSKHLRVLSKAGLVKVQPQAQKRIYRLAPQPLKELDGWLQSYKQMWEERLDRLEEFLKDEKPEEEM